MVKEFVALDKRKALRLALDYWYRNFAGKVTLTEFVAHCTWKKVGTDYIVTYYDFRVAQKDKWR